MPPVRRRVRQANPPAAVDVAAIMHVDADVGAAGAADVATNVPSSHTTIYWHPGLCHMAYLCAAPCV